MATGAGRGGVRGVGERARADARGATKLCLPPHTRHSRALSTPFCPRSRAPGDRASNVTGQGGVWVEWIGGGGGAGREEKKTKE
jgi:hypothetical protein